MARVHLAYEVPVSVVVDTDTGEVERVRILDELIRRDFDGKAVNDDGQPVRIETAETAEEIASDADWPAWEIG